MEKNNYPDTTHEKRGSCQTKDIKDMVLDKKEEKRKTDKGKNATDRRGE